MRRAPSVTCMHMGTWPALEPGGNVARWKRSTDIELGVWCGVGSTVRREKTTTNTAACQNIMLHGVAAHAVREE